uniref:Uncharacterized protein n=1 Tax=Rousettus aegyptiacus TaxID=9407 RepID=A0A7J8H1G6_ROUAE|nr:hypothetical protein HJG63_011408 [Rousettus aegyptiacus]
MRPGPGPPARAFVTSVQGGWGPPLSPGLPWPLRELGSHWGWGLASPTTSGWPSAQCPLWLDPPEPACPLGVPRALASVSQKEFGGPRAEGAGGEVSPSLKGRPALPASPSLFLSCFLRALAPLTPKTVILGGLSLRCRGLAAPWPPPHRTLPLTQGLGGGVSVKRL